MTRVGAPTEFNEIWINGLPTGWLLKSSASWSVPRSKRPPETRNIYFGSILITLLVVAVLDIFCPYIKFAFALGYFDCVV